MCLSVNALHFLLTSVYVDRRAFQKIADITIHHHDPTWPNFPNKSWSCLAAADGLLTTCSLNYMDAIEYSIGWD